MEAEKTPVRTVKTGSAVSRGFLPAQFCFLFRFPLWSSPFAVVSSLPRRVTREHRENLAKLAKQLSNKAKDSLRRVRSNAVAQVKKAKEGHSEDTIRLVEKQVGDRGRRKETEAFYDVDDDLCSVTLQLHHVILF